MRENLIGFLVKIRKKLNQLEREDYINQLKKQCEIGEKVRLYPSCSIYDENHNGRKNIRIGDRVLIGHDCNIFDNDIHPLDAEIRHKQFLEIVTTGQPDWINLNDEDVIIKDNAWIGCNVVILKGVTIGEGAVVGAGSVVTHDIPDYAIAHGNPAKVYRMIK